MGRRTPLWRLFAIAAGAGALVRATGPLADVDVFWHVRMGDRILDTHSLPTRELWDFPAVGRHWVPHSWLSDVALALAHRAGGWNGVVVLRLVLSVALLALVARAVLRGTDAIVGPLVFAAAAVALAPNLLDRPQLFALVLLAVLLPLLDRARAGHAPHPLVAAGLGWLWASLHGSWPLLPLAFGLAAMCTIADRGPTGRADARRLLVAAAATIAGAALTPAGPALLVRPYVVARATHTLDEWLPTEPISPFGAAYTAMLVALVVAWARAARVATSELLWAGGIALAGLVAWRNMPFATVLLAPIVAHRVSLVVPHGRRSEVPRWVVAAFGAIAGLVLLALTAASPTFPRDTPSALLATLRAQPGDIRVLNEYNIGGLVTGLGEPRVSAAVDGRVDAFPPGFLDRYGALVNVRGDWEDMLAELHPTHALLQHDHALGHVLEAERGWRRLGSDDTYVLLAAP